MHYKVATPVPAAVSAAPIVSMVQSPASPLLPSAGGLNAPPEPAVKHVWDYKNRRWNKQDIMVSMDTTAFQEGTLRKIFHMKDYSMAEGQQNVCAKISKDPNEPASTYFLDVEMQGQAKLFAAKFNAQQPPKRIDFILPWVVEFQRRRSPNGMGKLIVGVEPLLFGRYHKHSNNYGFVSPEDRNTPQAFSHWTFHASNQRMLVCDIQGVEDMYTDPQIHSSEGSHRWGKADMGPEGIRRFFGTHKCNAICEFLRLPAHSGMKKKIGFGMVMSIPRPVSNQTTDITKATRKTFATAAISAGMPSSPGLTTSGLQTGLTTANNLQAAAMIGSPITTSTPITTAPITAALGSGITTSVAQSQMVAPSIAIVQQSQAAPSSIVIMQQ